MNEPTLATYYYYLIETGEAIDKALMKYGATPLVIRMMKAYNAIYFMVELNNLLYECRVKMID